MSPCFRRVHGLLLGGSLAVWVLACHEPPPAQVARESPPYEPGPPLSAPTRSTAKLRCPFEAAPTFYEDNPTLIDPRPALAFEGVDRLDAATVGDADLVAEANSQLRDLSGFPNARSFLLVREDRLLVEHYAPNSHRAESRNVHSVSKSILGVAVARAIQRGDLTGPQQRVDELLPPLDPESPSELSIDDLLTMRSGLAWEEDETEYWVEDQPNWVDAIRQLPQRFSPGSQFNYSTGNTHVLSAVISASAGTSLCEFASRELFAPRGITVERWGSDPQGISSGGYNLYLTALELADFFRLFLPNSRVRAGMPESERRSIDRLLERRVRVDGEFDYGTLIWLRRIGGHQVAIAWGFGGQFVVLVPALDLMLVVTSDTAGVEEESDRLSAWLFESVMPALMSAQTI